MHPDYNKDNITSLSSESLGAENATLTSSTVPKELNTTTIGITVPTMNMTTDDTNDKTDSDSGVSFQIISIATVAAFLFVSNIGWVSLNQVVCVEILPSEIHHTANTFIVSFSFLSAFISIKMFADLVQSLDAGHTFYLFGGICLFAALFTLCFVPETSQK